MHSLIIPYPVLYSLLYTFAFVIALYFKNGKHHRNEPEVVRKRFVSVSIVCFGAILHVASFIHKPGHSVLDPSSYEISKAFLRFDNWMESILIPSFFTMVLYLGPLFDVICLGPVGASCEPTSFAPSPGINQGFDPSHHSRWLTARNLVIAPLAEELVFRAVIMFHMQSLCTSCWTLCVVSSLYFSLAHFHHVYGEMRHGKSFHSAFTKAAFQVCYTTVFGVYSGFLMLLTGNVLSAIIAHSLCNFMGLPDFFGAIERANYRWGCFGQVLAVASHVMGLVLWIACIYLIINSSWSNNQLSPCHW